MNCKPDPYLKLPVKSDAPGLSKTWVIKLAPRLWKKTWMSKLLSTQIRKIKQNF